MTSFFDKSRWATIVLAISLATLVAVPGTALAGPATDEYTLQGASAGGDDEVGDTPPAARPGDLPPSVLKKIPDTVEGRELATVATARELGAPGPTGARPASSSSTRRAPSSSDDERSVISAATGGIGTGPSLALVGALALIVAAAVALGRRRKGGSA